MLHHVHIAPCEHFAKAQALQNANFCACYICTNLTLVRCHARALLCALVLRAAGAQDCGVNEEPFENGCRTCLPGTYKFTPGTLACVDCINSNQSPDDNYCVCNAGYYLTPMYQCASCDPGTYLTFQNTIQTVCYVCDANSYSTNYGATSCSTCPEHSAPSWQLVHGRVP